MASAARLWLQEERSGAPGNRTPLNKEDYLCDKEKQTCDVLTSNNEKIIWDNVHLSIKGAKYRGKKIHRIN